MSSLPVLAEIGAPVVAAGRPWGLRRLDLEALGAVRESLAGRRVVLVTGPGEAHSDGTAGGPVAAGPRTTPAVQSVAVGLAAVAAAAGTPTVLVECDLARPRLAAALGLAAVPGLHEYLRWEATPEAVLQTLVPAGIAAGEGVAPLACVCAGRPGDSPRTLLGLAGFRHMTTKLRDAYGLTVLLGPPLEGAGGALDLAAAAADGSVAALARRPDRRAARSIGDALSWLQTPPLGAVVVTPAAEPAAHE